MTWISSFFSGGIGLIAELREESFRFVQAFLETREAIARQFEGAGGGGLDGGRSCWRASARLKALAEVFEAIPLAGNMNEKESVSRETQNPRLFR